MNGDIHIGKKDKGGFSQGVVIVVVVISIALLWNVGSSYIQWINSCVAQLDQAVQRIDALEQAMNALPGALPNMEAVAPLLTPPVVTPPGKVLPVLPAPPKSIPLRPLSAAPAAVAASWQQQMLDEHNKWRRVVDVPPLVWSVELERSAQQVVDQLAAGTCELIHSGSKYGENLHKSGARKWKNGRVEHSPKTPAQIVGEWGSEADNYRWVDNACAGVCGHYTQVVWKDTTNVGCAHARCGNDDDIAVCQYYPAGNVQGQRPF